MDRGNKGDVRIVRHFQTEDGGFLRGQILDHGRRRREGCGLLVALVTDDGAIGSGAMPKKVDGTLRR